MELSEILQQMVNSTPVQNINENKKIDSIVNNNKKNNQLDLMNQIGLAVKRR